MNPILVFTGIAIVLMGILLIIFRNFLEKLFYWHHTLLWPSSGLASAYIINGVQIIILGVMLIAIGLFAV